MSITTLNDVSECPTNEIELSHAKRRKACEHLANIQSCTKPNNFTYHCVFNTWLNATVEVCAPEIPSQGRLKICLVIFFKYLTIFRMNLTSFFERILVISADSSN